MTLARPRKTLDAPSAPPLISGLGELAGRYDALLCDVWGVLIDGRAHFPEAAAALAEFRRRGGTVVLITNASRPSKEVEAQLTRLGVPHGSYDSLVSAGETILSEIIARKGQACHHLGPPRDLGLLEAAGQASGRPLRLVPLEVADYVVCTGLNDERRETPDDYARPLEAMRARDLVMLCANPDIVVGIGGELVWCAGALAERYAALGGKVVTAGKPHAPIYAAALERAAALRGEELNKARVLAIGDGLATDIKGAARAGLDSLFLLEGVHRDELILPSKGLDERALAEVLRRTEARPIAVARELMW